MFDKKLLKKKELFCIDYPSVPYIKVIDAAGIARLSPCTSTQTQNIVHIII